MKLIDLLKEKSPKFHTRLTNNINKLDKYLEGTTLPFYTTHGIDHSESLIDNFDKLLPDDIKNNMNELEIFILLSSAYFHDIGMAVRLEDGDSQKPDQSKKEYDKRLDFIRRTHAERTHRYIMSEDARDKFDLDKGIASVLADICWAHSDNKYEKGDVRFKNDLDPGFKNGEREYTFKKLLQKESQKAVNKHIVRLHFLAALLRLCDELDINYQRAYEKLDDKKDDMPPISEFEHKKNKLILGINIDSKKFEIIADVFEKELYKGGGDVTAQNNKALTEVIIKLRECLLEVRNTLNENGLKYDQIKFQDQVIKRLQKKLESFGIEENSQPIFDDKKYNGAMLHRFFYELEKLDLSPEFTISNEIDFLYSDSDNFIENCDAIFLKYKYKRDSFVDYDLNSLKIEILNHLSQISVSSLSEDEISDTNKLIENYIKIVEKIPERSLETDEGIIRKNIPNLIEKWNNGKLKNDYYLPGIQKETLSHIIKDKYSYLRRENYKQKCRDHLIYIIFSETYFLNLLKNKHYENPREIFKKKLQEMQNFIKNEEYKNIKFYYHTNTLDAESKLISSELAFENSITNDSIIVINNINVTIEYYKKNIDLLEHMNTWKIKSIDPENLTFEFDKTDEFYERNKKYKNAFIGSAESSIIEILNKMSGNIR
jgi:hypothetical protein